MPLWTFSPTPIAYRNAVGSAGMVVGLPVRVESDMGNDYFTGLKNETEAIRRVQAGAVYQTRPGDVVREIITVYTQNGEVEVAVVKQDKGLEAQQVAEPIAIESTAEEIAEQEALALIEAAAAQQEAVGFYGEPMTTSNTSYAPPIESEAPSGYYDPNYYAPQEETYTDPYVGGQYVPPPSEPSYGTGDAPGYSGPENNYERGPDITSDGNQNYWL